MALLQNTGLLGPILIYPDEAGLSDGVQDIVTLWLVSLGFDLTTDDACRVCFWKRLHAWSSRKGGLWHECG